jgi:tetratricopeptide (TPR) repeat protein
MYDKFVARVNFSASPQDYIDELPMMIEKLRQDYELTNSPSIGYYLYFIETELYQQLNNFEQAKTTLLSMVELLKDNASVRTRNRLSIVYGNLANNELLLNQFEKGIKYAAIAGDYSKESQVNLNVIREVEFFLQLFQGKLDLAEQLIVELYQSSARQKASFLYFKRTYLYACLKNLQGDYKRSEELLGEVKEIEKDKEGWNIGIRLLQIMNLIDRGKHDLIETNVQNLKKYLGRLKGQSQARKRYAVILRILTRLMNDNYYFRKTFKRSTKYFDLLHSADDRFAWSVKGPEVVAFHEWFESRMEMRKFSYAQIFKVD